MLGATVLGAGCWVLGAGCWVLCKVHTDLAARSLPSRAVMGVRHYQDLECWQLANELKKEVYALVDKSPARDDRRFSDQIKDSAASAPSNIAEAFGCYRHPESARYARIARSSEFETHNHLGDGADRRYWSQLEAKTRQDLADRAIGALTRWIQYLMSSDAPDWPN